MAGEEGKIDPMYQFTIKPLFGSAQWEVAGVNIAFTNSALWMMIATIVLILFVRAGTKQDLIPGRWQMAVESLTGFIENMVEANIGKEGRKYVPYVFTLFTFILFANLLGLMPLGIVGIHPFTFTSHFMTPLIAPIEFISFMVRPFSLALRLFVAMMAGHLLLEVLASFVVSGGLGGVGTGLIVSLPSMLLMIAICALEILVAGIQAYVFALLTSLYINDAEHLH